MIYSQIIQEFWMIVNIQLPSLWMVIGWELCGPRRDRVDLA